jgi:hypothetical protein
MYLHAFAGIVTKFLYNNVLFMITRPVDKMLEILLTYIPKEYIKIGQIANSDYRYDPGMLDILNGNTLYNRIPNRYIDIYRLLKTESSFDYFQNFIYFCGTYWEINDTKISVPVWFLVDKGHAAFTGTATLTIISIDGFIYLWNNELQKFNFKMSEEEKKLLTDASVLILERHVPEDDNEIDKLQLLSAESSTEHEKSINADLIHQHNTSKAAK